MTFLLKKISMHKLPALMIILAANLAAFSFSTQARELSGDETDACGALLCLAHGAGRGESDCQGYLRRYFSIKFTRPDKTFEARRDFLSMCPTEEDPVFTQQGKPALINAIAKGAGNCDAAYLNSLNKAYYDKKIVDKGWNKWNSDDDTVRIERVEYIKKELPGYCQVYAENEYTENVVPAYVGVEKEDGHFVDPPSQ